jgi:hypothetical protein
MYSLVFDKRILMSYRLGHFFVKTAIHSVGGLLSFYWGRECLMDRFD